MTSELVSTAPRAHEALELLEAEPAVVVQGVTKSWPGRRVLDDIDLELAPGSVTWVGGRNGVGKTTLLRIVSGLIMPDEGFVWVHGMHPDRDRVEFQRRVGFLTAGDRGLYARLNVRQHLEFAARVACLRRRERRPAVAQAQAAFGLEELAERRVDRISLGQRQRLRLALTFLHRPDVALLDEPRNSLDDDGIALLVGAVNELRSRGGAVLWCSPSGEHSELGFDARYVIDGGRLEAA